MAIFWSTLAMLATALLLRELLRGISDNRGLVNATALLAVLGSPTWHYGRMLFSEPWLALCAVGALTFATRKNAFFVAGLLMAVAIQMKPPFALVAAPLFIDRLVSRDVKRAAAFALPIVLSVTLIFLENQLFWGAPLRSAQQWSSGNLLIGMIGGLFSISHGLIPYCPAVLVALAGFPALFRTHRRVAWLTVGMVVPYCLLMWSWWCWWGDSCYGPRLIGPIIPLLFVGALKVFESLKQLSEQRQRLVAALCSLSVLISAIGAIVHLVFWEKHPLIEPWVQLAKHI